MILTLYNEKAKYIVYTGEKVLILKTAAVICEYNPFHNGHQYHIAQTRRQSGADYIIAVMSGNFVQRGEPAIINKWARAEMALQGGADLVLELPLPYAVSSAQHFARGAVELAAMTGVVNVLSFGSETGAEGLARLQTLAEADLGSIPAFSEALQDGLAYPAAAEAAFRAETNEKLGANDILALEYLRALRAYPFITPLSIRRAGAGHNSTTPLPLVLTAPDNTNEQSCTASAFYIRGALSEAARYMPKNSYTIMEREFSAGRGPVMLESFTALILYILRIAGPEGLRRLPGVSEGLEYKLYRAALHCADLNTLLKACTSRRYTKTRIKRILTAALLRIPGGMHCQPVPYLRILGLRRTAAPLLRQMHRTARLPLFSAPAKFRSQATPAALQFLSLECAATDCYVLGYQNAKAGGADFTTPIILC